MKNHPKKKSSEAQIKKPTAKQIQLSAQTFSGPLPHPEILEYYNRVAPDAANRILSLVEKQSSHRQELELKVIESDIFNSKCGLFCGLIIGLTSVIGGVLCVLQGHDTGGSIIGGVGLTSLVSVFVYGSRERRKERENRLKQLNNKQINNQADTK